MSEVNNGSWNFGLTGTVLLAGDFTKSIIGIRRDISFKMFDQGVISNDSGQVIMNLMQQDSVAMRMTMRLAYACVNPVTIMNPGQAITARWPFGTVLPSGATPPTSAPINVIGSNPYPYPGTYSVDPEVQAAAVEEAGAANVAMWEENKGHEVTEGEPPEGEDYAATQEAIRSGKPAERTGTGRADRAERAERQPERRTRPGE
jgi:hypothetical protein